MSKMADPIREGAINDRLLASGGVSGFVQSVLVPELGVRLIMEDMSVNEEKAKIIMKDTIDVGDLVNPDEGGDIYDYDSDDGFVPLLDVKHEKQPKSPSKKLGRMAVEKKKIKQRVVGHITLDD